MISQSSHSRRQPAPGSRILGLGHAVPDRVVTNEELEASLNLAPGWIERRTGIRQRRWAGPDDRLSDLANEAAARALQHSGVDTAEVGLLLLATSTPDLPLPPTAPLLAHRLGLQAGAIDLTGACSGFLYALIMADMVVRTQGKTVLIIGANLLSRRINVEDRNSAVLFADAAGALLLGPGDEGTGVLGSDMRSDGSLYGLMSIPPGGSAMEIHDGPGLFKAAIETMAASARAALDDSGVSIDDISRLVPHQANARMFEPLCKLLPFPPERTVRSVTDYGNSSAATIPLSLSLAHRAEPFQEGETILMTAAGAGLMGAAAVVRF